MDLPTGQSIHQGFLMLLKIQLVEAYRIFGIAPHLPTSYLFYPTLCLHSLLCLDIISFQTEVLTTEVIKCLQCQVTLNI